MPTLLASLSTGKGTWSDVNKIIQSRSWDKVFLITNKFGRDTFTQKAVNTSLIVVDTTLEVSALTAAIKKELQGKITDFEIALNFVSGSGKEHLALLEAVLESGLNFRLIAVDNGRVEILGLSREPQVL